MRWQSSRIQLDYRLGRLLNREAHFKEEALLLRACALNRRWRWLALGSINTHKSTKELSKPWRGLLIAAVSNKQQPRHAISYYR